MLAIGAKTGRSLLLAGDEFGVNRGKIKDNRMVFDTYREIYGFDTNKKHLQQFDLRGFITALNFLLQCLPSASENFWVEYLTDNTLHGLGFAIRHTHEFGNINDNGSLVCVNISYERNNQLTNENLITIANRCKQNKHILDRCKRFFIIDDNLVAEFYSSSDEIKIHIQPIPVESPTPLLDHRRLTGKQN